MIYETLQYELLGAVGLLTLNRPDKLNAMTNRMFDELNDFWSARQDRSDCRVIVLSGAGRAFCAGADISEMENASPSDAGGFVEGLVLRESRIHDMILLMRRIPQPLIAAVHGWAAGGGFSLAMACDIRVVDATAQFMASFINVGLSACDMGSSFHLPNSLNRGLANEILMTGDALGADRAARIGLVNHVTPENMHLEKAMEIAGRISRRHLAALSMTKKELNNAYANFNY